MLYRLKDAVARAWPPAAARRERRGDRSGLPALDPGIESSVAAVLGWLCRAQDLSASRDGGVARHFSLVSGWSTSYPETTGYIVSTFLECSKRFESPDLRDRARRMIDWLRSIQFEDGGFPGGTVGQVPHVPVVFNTGQVLLGLTSAVRVFGDDAGPMHRAADWLVRVQDPDGAWRQYTSPFARGFEKTFDAHIALGLLAAARLDPARPWADAALANIRWGLGRQRGNGWLADCCLNDPQRPLTHTLAYALQGIIEGYLFTRDPGLLEASRRMADGLLGALRTDGFLPGRLCSDWSAGAGWACLTGTAQSALCWLMLHRETGDERYRDAAFSANRFLRRTMHMDGPPDERGGVKGSFPVDGDYNPYQYLSWAAKFFLDANLFEEDLREGRAVLPPVEGVRKPASWNEPSPAMPGGPSS